MEKHMASSMNLSIHSPELLALVNSKLFLDRFRNEIGRRILYEVQLHDPIAVEHDVDKPVFDEILAHIQNVWTRLGSEEPHWSVVSTSDFRADKIKGTIGRFNDTGKAEAANLARLLARVGFRISNPLVLLEYGCGVGRVTRWLAEMFERVVGVDISLKHLSQAQNYFMSEKVSNVEVIHISRLYEIEDLPSFDFLYSKIVLQHNPPPIISRIFAVLCSKLRPGGVGVVQIPTYALGYSFRAKEYLTKMHQLNGMEMHVLPQPVVFNILDSCGCVPLEVSRDHLVTTVDFVSTTFVFQKRNNGEVHRHVGLYNQG